MGKPICGSSTTSFMKNYLVIGKFYTEGFALHIAETLEWMGHNVSRFEPGRRPSYFSSKLGKRVDQVLDTLHATSDHLPAVRSRRMRELWQVLEDIALDGVIVCYDFLWPDEVVELKRRSRAWVAMWFPDHLANFHRAFFMNAPYDALFFKDPFIVARLSDVLASPVYYLPECFNPRRHCLPEGNFEKEELYTCDITTAGNSHSWRVAVLKHLSSYDVKLWGNPPPLWMPSGPLSKMYQGRGVYDTEKAQAFCGARIVLNNLHYGEIWGVNVRCFEAAGVGAFQMVDWRPGLQDLFVTGKELIAFSKMSDLKNQIEYWLPREDERRAIAESGQLRAKAEHAYEHRLELLLATMAGLARGYSMPKITHQVHCSGTA